MLVKGLLVIALVQGMADRYAALTSPIYISSLNRLDFHAKSDFMDNQNAPWHQGVTLAIGHLSLYLSCHGGSYNTWIEIWRVIGIVGGRKDSKILRLCIVIFF